MLNSDVEPIHQGWLIKSPPKKKIQFIKARWRRRYFVLHVPPASSCLPGSYHLDYYDSPLLKKKKGSIDLDLCEEILAKLGSAHYENLFSLETKHEGRDRKYFLAAATEDEMNRWVDCLCRVCGFRPDQDPSEGAVVGLSYPHTSVSDQSSVSSHVTSHIPDVVPLPHDTRGSHAPLMGSNHGSHHGTPTNMSQRSTPKSSVSNDDSMRDYKPLWECYSSSPAAAPKASVRKQQLHSSSSFGSVDKRAILEQVPPAPRSPRRDSVDSIPEESPPPPPDKLGQYPQLSVDVPNPVEIYDNPKVISGMQQRDSDDFYKVPPPNPVMMTHGSSDDEDFYKVPPAHPEDTYDIPANVPMRRSSKRDSGSSSGGSHSGLHQSTYDYPPPRPSPDQHQSMMGALEKHVRTSNIHSVSGYGGHDLESTYDVPPVWQKADTSLSECVPAPPPRPPHAKDKLNSVPPVSSNPYGGVPVNSKSHPSYQNSVFDGVMDDTYDVPPVHQSPLPPSTQSPKPPPNTQSPKLPPHLASLPPKLKGVHYINLSTDNSESSTDQAYMPMHRQSSPLVAGRIQEDSIYQAPPSNRSVTSGGSNAKPPLLKRSMRTSRNSRYSVENSDTAEQLAMNISVTNRTKSFKRGGHSINNDVQLPMPIRRHSSVSSESDSDSSGPLDRSCDNIPTHATPSQATPSQATPNVHPMDRVVVPNKGPASSTKPHPSNLTVTPPAPGGRVHEVQYLDLEMDSSNDSDSVTNVNRSPPAAGLSPTDYKEIDFIKTKALSETRRDREHQNKRTSSEKSTDD